MTKTRCAIPCDVNDHRRVYRYVCIDVTWPEYWELSNWRHLGYPSRSSMIRHRMSHKLPTKPQVQQVTVNNKFTNRLVAC